VSFAIYRHLLLSIGKDLSPTITVYRKSMVVKMTRSGERAFFTR